MKRVSADVSIVPSLEEAREIAVVYWSIPIDRFTVKRTKAPSIQEGQILSLLSHFNFRPKFQHAKSAEVELEGYLIGYRLHWKLKEIRFLEICSYGHRHRVATWKRPGVLTKTPVDHPKLLPLHTKTGAEESK